MVIYFNFFLEFWFMKVVPQNSISQIVLLVGARPNFMKMMPIYEALMKYERFDVKVVHTGQHYDFGLSGTFLELFGLNVINLDVGQDMKGNEQLADMIVRLNQFLIEFRTELLVVFGDVRSTLAGALVACGLGIDLVHVESGNRCFDKTMPEEINRVLTDSMSHCLFVSEPNGLINLKREGMSGYYVGNPMIDTLIKYKNQAENCGFYSKLGLEYGKYILLTVHRQANLDQSLDRICKIINGLAINYRIIFPVHPHTRQKLKITESSNIVLIEPQGYLEFLNLMMHSGIIITDSGGCSEEASFLGVYCLTLRSITERPITCTHGTNILMKHLNLSEIMVNVKQYFGIRKKVNIPLWDGKAGERIAAAINKIY